MNKYTENMMTLVSSFKYAFKKEEAPVADAASARATKLTKPAKVPSWIRDLSLKMYIKKLETWNEINADIPDYIKYQDFVENLKGKKKKNKKTHLVCRRTCSSSTREKNKIKWLNKYKS